VNASEEMIEQLSTLIKECEEFCSDFPPCWGFGLSSSPVSPEEEEIRKGLLFLSYRLQAAIHRCTTSGDSYRKNVNDVSSSSDVGLEESLLPIAQALYADFQAGWFRSVSELIHADMFSDLLDIARELHESGYKDAAAVQAGTALELHLRLLAEKHNIETVTEKNRSRSKNAGDLNVELKKAGVYSLVEQHGVTAMLAIRNAAAHGHYDECTADKVEKLISDVREFVKRFPA